MPIKLVTDEIYVCGQCRHIILTGDTSALDYLYDSDRAQYIASRIWENVEALQSQHGGRLTATMSGGPTLYIGHNFVCETCEQTANDKYNLQIIHTFNRPQLDTPLVQADDLTLREKYTQLRAALKRLDPNWEKYTDYEPAEKMNGALANSPFVQFLDIYDLIADLQKEAPDGYGFNIKNGFFGFWKGASNDLV